MGVIVQKKDGAFFTTTDIAAAKYRYETLHADRYFKCLLTLVKVNIYSKLVADYS